MTPQDAKEFLIGRIVAQAERDGAPLGDAEMRMLYFSGNGSDPAEVEGAIRGVIRNARTAAEESDEGESWDEAVEVLRWEDPWLPRLIGLAGKPVSAGQFVRGVVIGSVIAGVAVIVIFGVLGGYLR
jgi:hypothetical protein